MEKFTVAGLAAICHDATRSYAISVGLESIDPPWAEASEELKSATVAAVESRIANPESSPEQTHEEWRAQQLADGWVHGEALDEAAKTNPLLVDYKDLPEDERAKDTLFNGVIDQMAPLVSAEEFGEDNVPVPAENANTNKEPLATAAFATGNGTALSNALANALNDQVDQPVEAGSVAQSDTTGVSSATQNENPQVGAPDYTEGTPGLKAPADDGVVSGGLHGNAGSDY